MRRDADISSPEALETGALTVRWWPIALVGLLSWVALAFTEAPLWAHVLLVAGWAGALAWTWWQRTVSMDERAATPLTLARPAAAAQPPALPASVWQQWVHGWYWETDTQMRLICLAPGAGATPSAVQADWARLQAWLGTQPRWCDAWPAGAEGGVHEQLRYLLSQPAGHATPLSLPWPGALEGLTADDGVQCELRMQPRWDAAGQWIGHQGVLTPICPIAEAACAAPAESPAPVDPVAQTEQEVWRYALSHDLRAPLRVVDGFTRIVREDYGHALDRVGNDHLDRVLAASARMGRMIDAVLAQAQLANSPLQRAPVDLSALVRDVLNEQVAVLSLEVTPQWDITQGMQVEADPVLLRRVLENLVGNALKYSAKVAHPRVEVGVMPSTNPPVYYVRDNGAGFDMQHADKLFGMFQRLHSAKDFPGTGVGLAGVHNIIRRHGGRVWAEARPGEGACFYFTLMGIAEAQQRLKRSE